VNTKLQIGLLALLCAACIGVGALWYRGCARSTGATSTTRTDTLRVEKRVIDYIPVTRYRTITKTESRIDTVYAYVEAGSEPASGDPVGDTTFTRSGVLMAEGKEGRIQP